jgi:transcription initiation factor TFIID subunit 13
LGLKSPKPILKLHRASQPITENTFYSQNSATATMEPRARAARHKGTLNFGQELDVMLQAYGAPANPDDPTKSSYSETVRVLDEIVTDFVIETCHDAVAIAAYSGRAKLKLADFEWALRKDMVKLGHTQTMIQKKKDIDSKKKVFDVGEVGGGNEGGYGGRIAVENLQGLAGEVGEEGTGKGKGRGKGKRKKKKEIEMAERGGDDAEAGADVDAKTDDGRQSKKAKSVRSEG